jgi:hypothetical protein
MNSHAPQAIGNRARLDLIPGLAAFALPLKTVGDGADRWRQSAT